MKILANICKPGIDCFIIQFTHSIETKTTRTPFNNTDSFKDKITQQQC